MQKVMNGNQWWLGAWIWIGRTKECRAYSDRLRIEQHSRQWIWLQGQWDISLGYLLICISTCLMARVSAFSVGQNWSPLLICSPPFYPSNQTDSQVTFQWETKNCGRTYISNIRLLMASYHMSALDSLSVKLNWQWVKVLNCFHTLGMHWIWY